MLLRLDIVVILNTMSKMLTGVCWICKRVVAGAQISGHLAYDVGAVNQLLWYL